MNNKTKRRSFCETRWANSASALHTFKYTFTVVGLMSALEYLNIWKLVGMAKPGAACEIRSSTKQASRCAMLENYKMLVPGRQDGK